MGTDPVTELKVPHGDRRRRVPRPSRRVLHLGPELRQSRLRAPLGRPYSFVPSPHRLSSIWENDSLPGDRAPFSTIGNWRQSKRRMEFEGRAAVDQAPGVPADPRPAGPDAARMELALASYTGRDRLLLAEHGSGVRPGLEISRDLDRYRDYILRVRRRDFGGQGAEHPFPHGLVASERSATYLAAGRPVILRNTGFGAALPTGEGLFAFTNLDEAAEAVRAVQADPARHRDAARRWRANI